MSTTSQIQRIIKRYRELLAHHEAKAVQALEAAYRHTLAAIQPRLDKLYREMAEKQKAGEQIPLHWLYEERRLESLKRLIINQVDAYGGQAQLATGQLQHTAVGLGADAAQEQMEALVPAGIEWSFGVASPQAIADLVGAAQEGSPLADLFAGFGEKAAADVSGVLLRGISLGEGPQAVARDIARVLDEPRQRAVTIARTELNRAYRSSSIENYRANDDVVQGWIWVCSLSRNSCAACVAMHGTHHSLEEELDDHVSGACAAVPETRSWADILGPDVDTSDLEDTSPQFQSGEDWLNGQSEETQRSILGAKYQGWNNGDFSLSDVVGHTHDPKWGHSIKEKPLKELVKAK